MLVCQQCGEMLIAWNGQFVCPRGRNAGEDHPGQGTSFMDLRVTVARSTQTAGGGK